MISIGKISTNPIYYVSHVASGPEAYYPGSGEKPGTWVGRGCEDLDLSGEVTEDALGGVLNGKDPASGASLVTGKAASGGRLGGFDFTFSAPKGVSLLACLSRQQVAATVRGAHDGALPEALTYLEDHATWARRGHNGLRTEATSGMVAAAFRHRTSRAEDPQLHTHVVVANLVHGNDARWSALWGKPIYARPAPPASSTRPPCAIEGDISRGQLSRRKRVQKEARLAPIHSVLRNTSRSLTDAFRSISQNDFVQEIRLDVAVETEVSLEVVVRLTNGRECPPSRVLSEGKQDLVTLLLFIALARDAANLGQNRF